MCLGFKATTLDCTLCGMHLFTVCNSSGILVEGFHVLHEKISCMSLAILLNRFAPRGV